jgi:predicted ATPase
MSLALVGAHRTGKTTLAREFAKKHDLVFVQTGISEVFARLGLDPRVEYPIEQRVSIQTTILYALEKQWESALRKTRFFVTDRAALDLAAYMLADVTRATLAGKPEVAAAIQGYVERCIESTNRFFHTVIRVQPGIKTVEAEGKALACPVFMDHLNAIYAGLMVDHRLEVRPFSIDARETDLEARMATVLRCLEAAQTNHAFSIGRQIEAGCVTSH